MRTPDLSPVSFAIVSHPSLPDAAEEAQQIATDLSAVGVDQVAAASLYDNSLRQRIQDKEFDLVIAVGGDGTMLRVGHLCAPLNIPVLGINAGRFGFLMEVGMGEFRQFIPRLLSGEFQLEDRMMLQARLERDGEVLDCWQVLNEVVVCRGQPVRPHSDRSLCGRHPFDQLCGRWIDRFYTDWLHCLCPRGRRSDHAP